MEAVYGDIRGILQSVDHLFGVFILDDLGKIRYVNNHFCKITEYERHDLLDSSYLHLKFQLAQNGNALSEVLSKHKSWQGNVLLQTKSHVKKSLHLLGIPFTNQSGKVTNYIFIVEDVTGEIANKTEASQTLEDLQNITNALDEASIVAITDEKGVIQHVNDKFCEISKYDRSELVGRTHRVINSKHHPKSFFRTMWNTILSGEVWNGEVKNRAKDGSYYWMNTTIVPFKNKEGKVNQFISIRTDITKRIKAEKELARVMEDDFKKVVQNLQNWVFKIKQVDGEMIVTLSEGKLAEELAIITDKVRGKTIDDVLNDGNVSTIKEHLIKAFSGSKVHVVTPYKKRFLDVMLTPVIENNQVTEVVGSIADITARKKAEDTIRHMANYDSLTNLTNRNYFSYLLKKELEKAKDNDETLAVMFLDLDRFKNINDSLGHLTGDRVLKKVATYLNRSVRKGDVVSRQGGDEFMIYLPDVTEREAGTIAKRIIQALAGPVAFESLELYVTPSIGISMFPKDGKSVEELTKNADAAMYYAKEQGRNNFQFYSEKLRDSISTKIAYEQDLLKALNEKQFELYYQPKIDISKNKITGVEALIRWNHPREGIVPPNVFIPIAEESGLIIQIGEWVLEEACAQVKRWHQEGCTGLTMAVNISFRQFMQNNLHLVVEKVLKKTGLSARYLELEITESMTADAEYTIRTLNKIKNLGVTVSIDDFGTGYSSLSYLSRFPVDKLKIDQSFVRDLNKTNQSIIKAIIDVAENLNVEVIAEGVEEKNQIEFLTTQGCTEAQGYFYSKPVPATKMNEILKKFSARK